MKDYLPDYSRKKGQPRNHSNCDEVFNKFPKETQDLINDYIKFRGSTAGSQNYITSSKTTLTQFFDVIGKRLEEVTKEDVIHFTSLINNSIKSSHGRHHRFYVLRSFFQEFGDSKFLKYIKNKRETSSNSRIKKGDLVTERELEIIIRQANNLRDKALIMLLFESAGRPDEIVNLKWKDIIFNDDGIAEISLFTGKKKQTRVILVKDCVIHLQRWKREYSFPNVSLNDWVFPLKHRDKPMTTQVLRKKVQTYAKNGGIERNIYSYLFRHSRLTFIRQKMKTPHYIQFAGHTERQAANYTHLDTDDLKEAMVSSIYPTEELTPQEKSQLDLKIKLLEEKFKVLQEAIQKL